VVECRSTPQMCVLGPMPPRTPGRSDAQVPSDASRGESKYGRIPFVYFYQDHVKDDATFGLLDIEIAQRLSVRDLLHRRWLSERSRLQRETASRG